ncbi:hypothetical protein GCM10010299_22580 [Streptomyces tanashiensis]|nr:hypothetical protein GCM10010299_22580 [Streptomyces tanashiensis]
MQAPEVEAPPDLRVRRVEDLEAAVGRDARDMIGAHAPTGRSVRLQKPDRESGGGEVCRAREAGHTGSDHDDVASFPA